MHVSKKQQVDEQGAERVLIIKAKGGLGNRILSAVTGLVYADLAGRTPVIDWRDGVYAAPGTNAYPLLFQSPIALDPGIFDNRRDVTPSVWADRLSEYPSLIVGDEHKGAMIYRKSCVDLSRLSQPDSLAVFWSYVPKMQRLWRHLRRDPRYRGRSYDSIMSDYLNRFFTPNDRVLAAATLEGLPRPVIGAHLRYTDMRGPLEAIKREIGRLRARLPESPVFLATDSSEAQADIQATFDNVHVTEKYLPEDGQQLHVHLRSDGVDPLREAENAMIDMWSLAACDYLVYSRNSTFSISSALIGGIPRSHQRDVDRHDPKIVLKRLIQNVL